MLKFNYEQLKISMIFLIGISLGWLICLIAAADKFEHKIGYISKDEIIKFERERVAKTAETSLFKGQVAHSAEMVNKIGRSLENKHLSVIFTSEEVEGTHVFSLSKKVHEETIKLLEQTENNTGK